MRATAGTDGLSWAGADCSRWSVSPSGLPKASCVGIMLTEGRCDSSVAIVVTGEGEEGAVAWRPPPGEPNAAEPNIDAGV